MILFIIFGIACVLGLAYANGANDISKSIATLVGGTGASIKKAIVLGSIASGIGAFCSLFFAGAILKLFTTGLIRDTEISQLFAISVLICSVIWILIATRFSMPVSTTHSLVGSVVFLGVFVFGFDKIVWPAIFTKVVVVLLVSPLIAFGLVSALTYLFGHIISRFNRNVLSGLHWISAMTSCFARGLQDAPKMLAFSSIFFVAKDLFFNDALSIWWLYALTGLAMGLGAYLQGRRVTNTLAFKVVPVTDVNGFVANAITSLLIIFGAKAGLPMSTTHVSAAAIMGLGERGVASINLHTVKRMALAWIVTLPAAGMLAIGTYMILGLVI